MIAQKTNLMYFSTQTAQKNRAIKQPVGNARTINYGLEDNRTGKDLKTGIFLPWGRINLTTNIPSSQLSNFLKRTREPLRQFLPVFNSPYIQNTLSFLCPLQPPCQNKVSVALRHPFFLQLVLFLPDLRTTSLHTSLLSIGELLLYVFPHSVEFFKVLS